MQLFIMFKITLSDACQYKQVPCKIGRNCHKFKLNSFKQKNRKPKINSIETKTVKIE